MAMYTFRGPDDESRLAERIMRLVVKGKPAAALKYYREWPLPGRTITSASTHHTAFVAAREQAGGREELLGSIYKSAQACLDYGESELNFSRDWAVYAAEARREFQEALQAIQEVIRSRRDDEDQDQSQIPVDMLALYKILVLQGGEAATQYAVDHLEELKENSQLGTQARLDVEWWYFIATLILRRDREAHASARDSLNFREGADPKAIRRRAWRATSIPWIGPALARVALKYKLGL